MRFFGFTFIGLAIAQAFLPSPLDWMLLVVVAVLFVICMGIELADRRLQAGIRADAETRDHLAAIDELRQMGASDDEAWERIQAALRDHPAPLVFPGKLRSVSIPPQRLPGGAS